MTDKALSIVERLRDENAYIDACDDAATLLELAQRLADYVRLTIETGGLAPESPIGIAYRDFTSAQVSDIPPSQLTLISPADLKSKTGLRPCPFCHSVDLSLITYSDKNLPLLIQCNGCGATGPTTKNLTEDQLRALWEKRTQAI